MNKEDQELKDWNEAWKNCSCGSTSFEIVMDRK